MRGCSVRECMMTVLSTCGFTFYLCALSVYCGSAFSLPPLSPLLLTPPPYAYSAIMKSLSLFQDGTEA